MRRELRELAAAELGYELPRDKPPAKTPFGFLEDVDTLLGEFSVYRKHGTMAVAGGWRDQPAEWRDGILTLNAMYAEEYEVIRRQVANRR